MVHKRTREEVLHAVVIKKLARIEEHIGDPFAVDVLRRMRNVLVQNMELCPATIQPVLTTVEAAYASMCKFHGVKSVPHEEEKESESDDDE